MKRVIELLKDRRRSQRGSVLSGVLIMTAFVGILSGALMTALSTNFLISGDLSSRVYDQATVGSAIELSVSKLQAAQLNAPCPGLTPVTINSRTAVPSYTSCWPTVDVRSPQFLQLGGSSAPFNVNGTHAQANGLNDYVVGNSSGTFFDYTFGSSSPRWTLPAGGSVTGPPLAMSDPNPGGRYLDVLAESGPPCAPSPYCLNVRTDNGAAGAPPFLCSIGLNNPVVSQPAASPSSPGLGYYAYGANVDATDMSVSGHNCDWEATATMPSGQPIVAGPVAYHCISGCGGGTDNVYVVASDSTSSRMYWLQYRSSTLTVMGSVALPWRNAVGIDVSGATLPASAVVTFHEGQVALVQIASSGALTLANNYSLSNVDILAAPKWCGQCGNSVGVGGSDGTLYVFDSSLTLTATLTTGAFPISTTPSADGAGNWYVPTDDGTVHEIQPQGASLAEVKRYGPMAQFGSSLQMAACPAGICLYLGALNNSAYLIQLDARDAVIWACLSANPPACSGNNPRVRAQVEIGVMGNKQTVHVQGWSYYSP